MQQHVLQLTAFVTHAVLFISRLPALKKSLLVTWRAVKHWCATNACFGTAYLEGTSPARNVWSGPERLSVVTAGKRWGC